MLKILNEKDKNQYMLNGDLSQPFLNDNEILNAISQLKEVNPHKSEIECLLKWINNNVPFTKESTNKKQKFNRNAKEIWNDKYCTGCTDRAIIFSTLARQIGIPTTILHTAEKNWVERLKNGQDTKMHIGHSFCECFVNKKWILIDPTACKIEYTYDCNNIHLSYKVGESSDFISYYRGLDLGKRQSIEDHNKEMDELCLQI